MRVAGWVLLDVALAILGLTLLLGAVSRSAATALMPAFCLCLFVGVGLCLADWLADRRSART